MKDDLPISPGERAELEIDLSNPSGLAEWKRLKSRLWKGSISDREEAAERFGALTNAFWIAVGDAET